MFLKIKKIVKDHDSVFNMDIRKEAKRKVWSFLSYRFCRSSEYCWAVTFRGYKNTRPHRLVV